MSGAASRIPARAVFHRISLPILTVLWVCAAPATADPIDDYLEAQMRRNHIPGLSVAVIRDGVEAKLRSYGSANLEWESAATPGSVFQLASATKIFTGMALMRLVERGVLALDAPVSKYLADAPEAWRPITLRHLATHTSGLPDDLGGERLETTEQIVAAAMKRPLAYQPGSRSAYGFTDFVVLQRVMEQTGGRPFPILLRELVFEPLQMANAAFNNAAENGPIRTADPLPRRASVYRWQDDRQRLHEFLFASAGYAAGGLYASVADLARFAVALQTGAVWSRASLAAMWEAPSLSSGRRGDFGIGWVVKTYRGRRAVGHSGGPALADILHFPDDRLTIIVLINQSRMYPYLAEGVADLLLPKGWTGRTIPDREPALTAVHRRVLEDASRGVVDDTLFAATVRSEFVPALRRMGPDVLGLFDPIRAVEVIEDVASGERRTCTYRVFFADRPMVWVFEMDNESRITSLRPGSE